jgi:hypothetical protein
LNDAKVPGIVLDIPNSRMLDDQTPMCTTGNKQAMYGRPNGKAVVTRAPRSTVVNSRVRHTDTKIDAIGGFNPFVNFLPDSLWLPSALAH